MEKYNILKDWKKRMYVLTSPLSITKNQSFDRTQIDFISNLFMNFFGEEYFDIKPVKHVMDPYAFLEKNSLYQLLNSSSLNSFFSLIDLAALISFSEKLDGGLYKNLHSVKNDVDSLRNYLFEIFVYRILAGNDITFQLKPVVNDQELEAIVKFKNKSCLVECKKFYSTEIRRHTHLKFLLNKFFKSWLNIQSNIFAFIFAPNSDDLNLSKEKELVSGWLKEYKEEVKVRRTSDFLFERCNSKGQKIIHIEKSNPGLFENLQKIFKVPHAYFSTYPPPIIIENQYNYFHFVNGYFFTIYEDDIQKKILSEIKRKRRQHKDSQFYYRIFFFENGSTHYGEFPLLTEKILKSPLINNYLNSKDSRDIICIIDKNLFPNQKPHFKLHVFCKPEFNEIKSELEKLDLKMFHV